MRSHLLFRWWTGKKGLMMRYVVFLFLRFPSIWCEYFSHCAEIQLGWLGFLVQYNLQMGLPHLHRLFCIIQQNSVHILHCKLLDRRLAARRFIEKYFLIEFSGQNFKITLNGIVKRKWNSSLIPKPRWVGFCLFNQCDFLSLCMRLWMLNF